MKVNVTAYCTQHTVCYANSCWDNMLLVFVCSVDYVGLYTGSESEFFCMGNGEYACLYGATRAGITCSIRNYNTESWHCVSILLSFRINPQGEPNRLVFQSL